MGRKREGPKGCLFYGHSLKQLDYLRDDQAGRVIKAAAAYFLTGEIREDLEPLENVVFGIMREDVDDCLERYRDVCARNKANRSRSSLPPGEYYVLPDGDLD